MPVKDGQFHEVRVRFAPSPTGPFHWGSARTALFNWLFARHAQGDFIIRIEDTDAERSQKIYEDQIFDTLGWLGLQGDEIYHQSDRRPIYREYLEKLLAAGQAYYCCCTKEELEASRQSLIASGLTPKYSGHCRNLKGPPSSGQRPQLIRFATTEHPVIFQDLIRGKIVFDAALFGDFALAKDLDQPLFHFAGVVDDATMKISHVIRGEDHISNTPRQILIQRALGFSEPIYAHLPLILAANREKLSKRYLEQSLRDYEVKGYLPEAIVNFLALLGWHPKDDQEVLSRDELINRFKLHQVQKGGAIFNEEKLTWLNSEHLKNLDPAELRRRLEPWLKDQNWLGDETKLTKIIAIARDRIKTLQEFVALAGFFFRLPEYPSKLLVWKNQIPHDTHRILQAIINLFTAQEVSDLPRTLTATLLEDLISEEGRGQVLWPLRVAVSGQAASPDPLDIIAVLGRDETVRRLRFALKKLTTHDGF